MDSNALWVVLILGLLGGVAFVLERRAKSKGDLLTGQHRQMLPGARVRFYVSLLASFLGAALGIWGIVAQSIWLLVLGVFIFLGSIALRFYWQMRGEIGYTVKDNPTSKK